MAPAIEKGLIGPGLMLRPCHITRDQMPIERSPHKARSPHWTGALPPSISPGMMDRIVHKPLRITGPAR